MFQKKSLTFLEKLLSTSSPTGFEAPAAKVFREETAAFCDRVETDVLGNTIAAINPDAPFRVMLAGHYDEIGFQITYITDEGLLYFRANGGIDKLNVPASEVDILTANGPVRGVIGKKPIHLLKQEERNTPPALDDMWIDIGVDSRKEVEKLVSVGDPVANRVNFRMLNAHRVCSKGLDDKIGAFVVAETMRQLAKRRPKVGVFGVGTVQEEVGYRGARVSCFGIAPQVGFAIDVGFATDLPDIPKKKLGEVTLGKGPELNRSCDNNLPLYERLIRVSKKHKIPVQLAAGYRDTGGTDTCCIQMNRDGVATALLSIPNRYMHSQVEMCDLRDAAAAVDLLTETILSFTGKETFRPGLD